MLIEKQYKFYAAHRNEELDDKCRNLHGHRYGVRCVFQVERCGEISTLFGDFDAKIEPWLREQYDHAMLINVHDPLFQSLRLHEQRTGESLRMNQFDRPTSVENLCHKLFSEISDMGFLLERLEIQETDTSVVCYTRTDWMTDNRLFRQVIRRSAPEDVDLACQQPTVADCQTGTTTEVAAVNNGGSHL